MRSYQFGALGNTSLDPKNALDFSDPNVIWVILSGVGVLGDIVSIGKLTDKLGEGKNIRNAVEEMENLSEAQKAALVQNLEQNQNKVKGAGEQKAMVPSLEKTDAGTDHPFVANAMQQHIDRKVNPEGYKQATNDFYELYKEQLKSLPTKEQKTQFFNENITDFMKKNEEKYGKFVDEVGKKGDELIELADDVVHRSDYKISESRKRHILDGDPVGTGHGPNRGQTEGVFPDSWTDNQVIDAIERVVNSKKSTWKQAGGPGVLDASVKKGGYDINAPELTNKGKPVRFKVQGYDHGLKIEVIVAPKGEGVITGYVIGKR